MKNLKNYLPIIVVTIVSVIIVAISSSIYDGGFLNDKMKKNVSYEKAIVKSIQSEKMQNDTKLDYIEVGTQDISLEIQSGEYKGQIYNVRNSVSRLYNMKVKSGSEVVVTVAKEDGQIKDISLYTHKKDTVMITLIVIFAILIVVIGKMKGLKSLVALIFTFINIIYLMVPLMFRGVSPILAAILVSLVITIVTLYLLNGNSKKTYGAIAGTMIGIITAGIIAYIAGNLSNLSGINMENTENILYVAENSALKVNGLMFAGILIASLGAIMDVAISIASSLSEIYEINSKLTAKDLFKSGMNIGKDMLGTMSNTLILAFAGGSLSLIILLSSANMNALQLLNLDVLCTEVIQGISGSIGIVLTVPCTAYICAKLFKISLKK